MGSEGAYTTLQAVVIMQQFGLKRGPELYAYQLSAQAMASILNMILVETLKVYEGFEGMFIVAFMGLLVAVFCNYLLDEDDKIKFTDFYETE